MSDSRRGGKNGYGRGGGSGNRASKTGKKTTFHSTRIEDQLADVSEDGKGNLGETDDAQDSGEGSESSSDSEDEVPSVSIQPYTSLLQSLNSQTERGAPQRKKQKFDSMPISKEDGNLFAASLDEVEEPEEVENLGIHDFDDEEQPHDPFIRHLEFENKELNLCIEAVKHNTWSTSTPSKDSRWSAILKAPQVRDVPLQIAPTSVCDIKDLHLKHKLRNSAQAQLPSLENLNGDLAFSIFHYRDVLFPNRTLQNSTDLRKLTCLHLLNHLFKTRDKVIKNNARLIKEDPGVDLEFRDQGFTRPKILILLPTRRSCVNYVDTLVSFCAPEQQENKKRFQDSYVTGDRVSAEKPPDFRDLFDGNDDDMFRLGLKFTRKTIKFFAQFYNSDIILASPLGLRMALGADDPKKQDNDFLSSIEIVIMDYADSLLMQNWEHVECIMDHLNLQPKEAHGCDFSRVRNWYLDGNAKYLRQTILLSAFNFPALNKIYVQHMLNVAGKMKYSRETDGAIVDLNVPLKQTFSRFEFGSPLAEPDNRFKYFISAIVPSLMKSSRHGIEAGQGVLIYLPSYADFVRVRNYLATSSITQNISFGSISEYTSVRDVARARGHFLSGKHSVLLYTERAHHFRRYKLKGVKRVIMYGLPENPIFYTEVVAGFLGSSLAAAILNAREAKMRALFSKLEALKLERIVGTGRYLSMLKEKAGDTFDFV